MDELMKARQRLSARVSDPKVAFVPGLKEDLRALVTIVDEFERRTAVLSEFMLRKHYWPTGRVRPEWIQALAAMGDNAANAARTAAHGERCTCSECLPVGGAL